MQNTRWWSRRTAAAVAVATAAVVVAASTGALTAGASAQPTTSFRLYPNKAFVACARAAGRAAVVNAAVTHGANVDTMVVTMSGLKPGIPFTLFSIESSNQHSDGTPAPGFANFGLANYLAHATTNSKGQASVTVRSILLNRGFSFDPNVSLPPTQALHLGMWFSRVSDAQPCSQSTLMPTPFNGEHTAGPLAFITRPSATTGLGPLCTKPEPVSAGGYTCHP